MKHTIRRTMVALGAGVVVQRLCQLVGFLLVGRALGVEGLGVYAQGLALAAALTVLAGAGVHNLTARAIAARPDAARSLVLRALRQRATRAAVLGAVAATMAFVLTAERPWFWVLCALQPLVSAFDLKFLLDAAGRARREIGLETGTAIGQLTAIVGCIALGGAGLEWFAAIAVACRAAYAAAALRTALALPAAVGEPAAAPPGWRNEVAFGQLAHELLTIGDVWLVAVAAGDAAAGHYAVGARFAAAALMPSAQLARLLLPHLLHADAGGDARRALGTALRATSLLALPMAAGGIAAADALCRLGGAAFAAAAPALCLLLVAGCLQHVGWQCSNALLASRRDRACAFGFAASAGLQAALLATLSLAGALDASTAAMLAAAAAAASHAVYAGIGLAATRALWRSRLHNIWHAALLAGVTAAAAFAPVLFLTDGPWRLPAQLAAGGLAFAWGLWRFELRGRWRGLGNGLAAASGMRA